MEEKLIIRSEFISFEPFRIIAIILCGLLAFSMIFHAVGCLVYNSAEEEYERSYYGYGADIEKLYDAADLKAAGDGFFFTVLGISIPIFILILYIYLYLKYSMIVISNKRVVGKTLFKRVDLPIDSISAVKRTPFLKIGVCTGRGTVSFAWIKNRDAMYSIICDLLVSRQPELNTDIEGNIEL